VNYHFKMRPAATTAIVNTGAGPAPHPGTNPTHAPVANTTQIVAPYYASTDDSTVYDHDFQRLLGCINPYEPSLPAPKACYVPGTMAGIWEGRFAYFEFDAYRDMLVGAKPPSIVKVDELFRGTQPQVWRISEYHLRASSATRQQTTPTEPRISDTIEPPQAGSALNAHFPTRCRLAEVPGGLEFHQEGKDCLFYEKYVPDAPSTADPEEPILDTLITGSGHSAWGPFTIRGRVRNWDGLTTLLKDYSGSDDPMDISAAHDRGRWLYRGYILSGGRNWVGRWRDTVTELRYCGYEGAFALHARR